MRRWHGSRLFKFLESQRKTIRVQKRQCEKRRRRTIRLHTPPHPNIQASLCRRPLPRRRLHPFRSTNKKGQELPHLRRRPLRNEHRTAAERNRNGRRKRHNNQGQPGRNTHRRLGRNTSGSEGGLRANHVTSFRRNNRSPHSTFVCSVPMPNNQSRRRRRRPNSHTQRTHTNRRNAEAKH